MEDNVLWNCPFLTEVCQRGFSVMRVGDPEDLLSEAFRCLWGRVRRMGRKVEMKGCNSVGPDGTVSAVRMDMGLEKALWGRKR